MSQPVFFNQSSDHLKDWRNVRSNLQALGAGRYYGLSTQNWPLRAPGTVVSTKQPGIDAFAELHAERVYLLNRLQHENRKAIGILRKIFSLDEGLGFNPTSFGRRDAKKKLGTLRCRIKETNRQEQAILARLGQLSFEIQQHDRWMLVAAEWRYEFRSMELCRGNQNEPGYICQDTRQTGTCSIPSIEQTDCTLGLTLGGDLGPTTTNDIDASSNAVGENLSVQSKFTAAGSQRTHFKIPRSSSMDCVELAILGTGSSFASIRRTKRNSLSETLTESSKP